MSYYSDYDPDIVEMQGLPQIGQTGGWEPQGAPAPAAGMAVIPQVQTGPADFGPLAACLMVVAGFVALRLWVHFAPDSDS